MAVATQFSNVAKTLPVRDDITGAFRGAWDHISGPGSWWTGAQRIAIAAEFRNARSCKLCKDRKAALSPNAVSGEHDSLGELSPVVVDVIHRIGTDPGRLTATWYEQTMAGDITDGQYVEIVGVIACVIPVDAFHRALGIPIEPLPEPRSGDATGYRPNGATLSGGWVPMMRERDLDSNEAGLYGEGASGNVIRALSLVPAELKMVHALSVAMYIPQNQISDFGASGDRAIDRRQIELLAARVSAINECFY